MPGGFEAVNAEPLDIEIDFDLDPEPANDVAPERAAHPPPAPVASPPPVGTYALPTPEEIQAAELEARREQIRGLGLMFMSAIVALLIGELLILAFM